MFLRTLLLAGCVTTLSTNDWRDGMLMRPTYDVSSNFDATTAKQLKECDDVSFFSEGGSHYVSGWKGDRRLVYAHLTLSQSRQLQGIEEPRSFKHFYDYGRRADDSDDSDETSYGMRR